jgi:Lrp/AsnC family leucine-responsive transcriptional regulator
MRGDGDSAIDALDLRLIELLERNARSTYGELGRQSGMSAPAAKRRVDRLIEAGVLLGFTALVDHARLGQSLQAFVELRFSGNARVDQIAALGDEIPEVVGLFTMAGDPDALAWVRVRDVQDLKRVVDRIRASANIIGTKTMIVLAGTDTPPQSERPGRTRVRPLPIDL